MRLRALPCKAVRNIQPRHGPRSGLWSGRNGRWLMARGARHIDRDVSATQIWRRRTRRSSRRTWRPVAVSSWDGNSTAVVTNYLWRDILDDICSRNARGLADIRDLRHWQRGIRPAAIRIFIALGNWRRPCAIVSDYRLRTRTTGNSSPAVIQRWPPFVNARPFPGCGRPIGAGSANSRSCVSGHHTARLVDQRQIVCRHHTWRFAAIRISPVEHDQRVPVGLPSILVIPT